METLSISEVQRDLQKLKDFDVLEIVDKKRNIVKGYFLDSSYKDLIQELMNKKKQEKKQLLGILGVVNSGKKELPVDELKDEKLSKYE